MHQKRELRVFDSGYDVSDMLSNWISSRFWGLVWVFVLASIPGFAKDVPMQVINWPSTGTPVVRFSFGKLKPLPGMSNLRAFVMDTTAENLSTKAIPSARFTVYLFDKNKDRIGEDAIGLTNVGPGETVKFETTVTVSGTPVSVAIEDDAHSARTITLTVHSTPEGAMLRLDGVDVGDTPRLISVGPGKHTLKFIKDGFTAGNFPLEISSNDVSGGNVSFELGAASYDSIELRDGSVLNGDLVSVSGMDVEIRVGGEIQHIDRNKIKRVLFVERDAPATQLPAASVPQP